MVNGKWLPDFIELLKASAWHQLYLPLLPFTHAYCRISLLYTPHLYLTLNPSPMTDLGRRNFARPFTLEKIRI